MTDPKEFRQEAEQELDQLEERIEETRAEGEEALHGSFYDEKESYSHPDALQEREGIEEKTGMEENEQGMPG